MIFTYRDLIGYTSAILVVQHEARGTLVDEYYYMKVTVL